MSDTPRTDNACGWPMGQHGIMESTILSKNAAGPFVHASVARELERENVALREQLEQAAIDEGKLRRENTRLLEAILNSPKARKEAQP